LVGNGSIVTVINASDLVGCQFGGGLTTNPPGATGTSTQSPSMSTSSSAAGLITGVAAGGVLLLVIIVLVLVIWRRNHSGDSGLLSRHLPLGFFARGSSVTELEQLVHQKVERVFTLAFAGKFGERDLAEARTSFAHLEVPRKQVKLDRLVGQGQSGEVHLGRMSNGCLVAVKLCRGSALEMGTAGEESLQLEARLLFQLRHTHIVQVLATVSRSLPTLVCLEWMANGDLKTYLRLVNVAISGWWVFVRSANHAIENVGRADQRCAAASRKSQR
jgi:hypothetical protein